MEFLTDFSQSWGDPQMRHAMLVHLPIVLSLAAFGFTLAAAIRGRRTRALQWIALIFMIGLAVTAFAAKQSGDAAEDTVEAALSDEGREVLHEHEELGEAVWLFGLASAVLLAATFWLPRIPQAVVTWIAACTGLVGAFWTANTGHFGGQLVYRYGAAGPAAEPAILDVYDAADSSADTDPRLPHFRAAVLPVLRANCWKCHNPQRKDLSGNLDQTSIASILEGGGRGPAVLPGRPEESILLRAIRWEQEDLRMPPKTKLSDHEIEAISKWIADGAVWAEPSAGLLPPP